MLVGDLLVLISILCWVYKIVPTPHVQHNSSMVFIIHPDLPSGHLLLLNHPVFAFPKRLGSSWCSLVLRIDLSIPLPLISHLALLISTNLICLIHNYVFEPLLIPCFWAFFFFLSLTNGSSSMWIERRIEKDFFSMSSVQQTRVKYQIALKEKNSWSEPK